ncbi:PiggyBac transposable element-derived protein 4, partial [Blattella germanica]
QDLTATHAKVNELTQNIHGQGYKLYIDNFFSSPDLFNDVVLTINFLVFTSILTRLSSSFSSIRRWSKLKRGDIRVRSKHDLTAIIWKDKRGVHMLTNIHNVPAEANFCDSHGNALIEDYNRHMGYVDKSDRMADSYSISRRTMKWTKKLFSSG